MTINAFLDLASQRYYAGNPIIADTEFDKLAEQHGYERVGTPSVRDGVPHAFPMYSLQKAYVGEKEIVLGGETVETPKIDGAAVSLLYINGELKLALTRGDGKRGQEITDKMRTLVPNSIRTTEQVVQITGEVAAKKTIPNARNYAAGALNLKDLQEFKTRELTFFAYGIYPTPTKAFNQDMLYLITQGFNVVGDVLCEEFPQDGKVIRLDDNAAFAAAGYTSNHPKGAYALKERSEGVQTTLLDVVWQVGRTGIVSPVAILDPVMIGDATISRATLHNKKYIEELGLELGCRVEIIRSGEIIPRVVRKV